MAKRPSVLVESPTEGGGYGGELARRADTCDDPAWLDRPALERIAYVPRKDVLERRDDVERLATRTNWTRLD